MRTSTLGVRRAFERFSSKTQVRLERYFSDVHVHFRKKPQKIKINKDINKDDYMNKKLEKKNGQFLGNFFSGALSAPLLLRYT